MKRIVVVSDLHCGSIYGMLPPVFVRFNKMPAFQHVGQSYLWDCWINFCGRVHKWRPDYVIVNGDCVDGMQRANHGSEISLDNWRDQRNAAIDVLKELQKGLPSHTKWYFTQGTPYHVGHFGNAEEDIAEKLDGQRYFSLGTGDRCREVLWLDVEGVIVEAAHHISVSTGFYRLTAHDREGQWSSISAKDATKGVPKSDLLIRSHVHYFGHAEHASKHIVTTPAWQLQTRYMRKNSVHRMHPDIGGLFIKIDGERKLKGESPCLIRKELYPLPPVPVTKG